MVPTKKKRFKSIYSAKSTTPKLSNILKVVKELDGNWDGVEIRVVRAVGEVLDFR